MRRLAAIRDALCEEALVCLLTGQEDRAKSLLAQARRMCASAVRDINVSRRKRKHLHTLDDHLDRPYWQDDDDE